MKARLLVPGMLLAASASLAACSGAVPAGPEATAGPSTSPSATTGAGTQLTLVYEDGTGKTSTWQLSCDPAGGDIPDPTAACAALTKSAATALPAVSEDKMCTQQFGGPQTAILTGTWQGRPVDSQFKRTDGCEISRWEALVGLLPRGGA